MTDRLLQTADAHLQFGEVADALAALDEAVCAAPDDPRPYLRRADVLLSARERAGAAYPAPLQAALDDLHRAAALGMDTPDLHFKRMIALADLGRVAEAREALIQASRLNPDDPRLWEWDARLAERSGDLAAALAAVRAARARQPEAFGWARREADLLLRSGDLAAARDAFSALIDAHAPADPVPGAWEASRWVEVYLCRAEATRRLGDFDAALADLDAAEAHLPGDPGITFARGLVAWARGDAAAARDLVQAALDAAAPGVRAEFHRALAEEKWTTDGTDQPG